MSTVIRALAIAALATVLVACSTGPAAATPEAFTAAGQAFLDKVLDAGDAVTTDLSTQQAWGRAVAEASATAGQAFDAMTFPDEAHAAAMRQALVDLEAAGRLVEASPGGDDLWAAKDGMIRALRQLWETSELVAQDLGLERSPLRYRND